MRDLTPTPTGVWMASKVYWQLRQKARPFLLQLIQAFFGDEFTLLLSSTRAERGASFGSLLECYANNVACLKNPGDA